MGQLVMLIALMSMAACSKKKGEFVHPKLKSYDFTALNGVPAFANLSLKESDFIIASKALGDLQFNLKHVTDAKFNDREALFVGDVKSLKTGLQGKAYMYDGIGGIQIGMDFIDGSNVLKRYQIRNISTMHESYKEIEGNPNYLKGTAYTQSVKKEMKAQGIPESETSKIVLEENGNYELIDMSAFSEIAGALNPASSVKQNDNESNDRMLAPENNSKRAGFKSNWIVFTTYTLNGNPFGEYTYNRYVDACAKTYAAFDDVDPLNTMSYDFFMFNIDTKAGNVELVWNSNSATFLENWQRLHDALGYFPDYWETKCVNALCVGNGWNDRLDNSYSNTFGDRHYNVCVLCPRQITGRNPYIETRTVSTVLGATIATEFFSYSVYSNGSTTNSTNQVLYEDVMCNEVFNFTYVTLVNKHLDPINRQNIQKFFVGY